MASVHAANVSINYPVFTAASQSLRRQLLARMTGGKIDVKSSRLVEIQAVDHVSFTIKPGERVALIGHNGSGKSTLLRAMARIYHPCAGRMQVEGKVAALFDTSFGLDFEAAGYENIMLRSLLLDVARGEIEKKIEDIIEFSELGEFIHMPLRTYSSGMVARLAFAIATAVDADILLIDEGIGAGDAAFMNKADRRLKQFIERSQIVVLASHSERLLRAMCRRGIVMRKGRIVFDGDLDEALDFSKSSQVNSAERVGPAEVALAAR
jgi:ABC-2 type transport system ATP-binding protein/lipopolysaccharide transport system ATP-binding protein